jgi:FKBP-type peptidyl-prolyl cis-trans isomerase FkpA
MQLMHIKIKTQSMIRKNGFAGLVMVAVFSLISLPSCDPSKKLEKEEVAMIENYLNSNTNLNFELKSSGLYYLDLVVGDGRQAVTHDTAYMKYTGKFLDGTVFDTNVGDADTLIRPVNEGWLIPGYDEGMTYMKEGGKALFLIPSKLGYGSQGWYAIPGYTPVLFEVEMVKIKPGPAK